MDHPIPNSSLHAIWMKNIFILTFSLNQNWEQFISAVSRLIGLNIYQYPLVPVIRLCSSCKRIRETNIQHLYKGFLFLEIWISSVSTICLDLRIQLASLLCCKRCNTWYRMQCYRSFRHCHFYPRMSF